MIILTLKYREASTFDQKVDLGLLSIKTKSLPLSASLEAIGSV